MKINLKALENQQSSEENYGKKILDEKETQRKKLYVWVHSPSINYQFWKRPRGWEIE